MKELKMGRTPQSAWIKRAPCKLKFVYPQPCAQVAPRKGA